MAYSVKPLTARQMRACEVRDNGRAHTYIRSACAAPIHSIEADGQLALLRNWLAEDIKIMRRDPGYLPEHMRERVRALRYGLRLRQRKLKEAAGA